ncbi:hypothetical protein ACRAWF_21325 [Streptomyces sp. L7]
MRRLPPRCPHGPGRDDAGGLPHRCLPQQRPDDDLRDGLHPLHPGQPRHGGRLDLRHGPLRRRLRPWLGGQLLASGNGDWGFASFAIAGLSSMVFIGIAALRSSKQAERTGVEQELVSPH